tara:strand:+ start:1491 stop:1595 length:105 start_codon:yes stop_codon:yes gene_type:complete
MGGKVIYIFPEAVSENIYDPRYILLITGDVWMPL